MSFWSKSNAIDEDDGDVRTGAKQKEKRKKSKRKKKKGDDMGSVLTSFF